MSLHGVLGAIAMRAFSIRVVGAAVVAPAMIAAGFLPAFATPALAQETPGFVDPRSVLAAATRAIGADHFRCLTLTGSASGGRLGQERYVKAEGDWPKDELSDFVRTINWQTGAMRESFDRTPGLTPASYKYGYGWTDGTPIQRQTRQMFAVSDGVAWHTDGPNGAPGSIAPEVAAMWQLDIWLNPVGFLKAAALPGADPIATWRWELGESGRDGPTRIPEKVFVVSILVQGKYRVDATINSRNLIQRIHTRFPHPVLGDLNVEHEFTHDEYVELGDGMRFPVNWHSHQGYDDNFNTQTVAAGHNAFTGVFPEMKANDCTDPIAVPAGLPPPEDPTHVETRRIAEGVYLLGGSTHNSVAVGFHDYVAVIEAPISERRSLAVIAEVVKLFPGKPIRFLVNTHQHFDHIGGLRTYVQLGATIITHARNYAFYNRDVINYTPRTMAPDILALMPPTELAEGYTYELVRENYVLTDGQRTMYINYVQPLKHAEGMLMAYVADTGTLVEADLVDGGDTLPAAAAEDGARVLREMVHTLGYPVQQIVPIHGQPIAWDRFVTANQAPASAASSSGQE